MKQTMIGMAILALVACVGCSTTNITKLTEALAKDPANVEVTVQTPYGSVHVVRTNPNAQRDTNNASEAVITSKVLVTAKPQ